MEIIELIYKDKKLLTMVEEAIDRAGTSVTDTSSLEETIYARIARYIKPDKGRIRHYVTLRKFIYETISDYVARYRNENTIVFSGLAEKDDEDDEIGRASCRERVTTTEGDMTGMKNVKTTGNE